MKICNNCNKTFTDDRAFCDNCGAPLSYAGMPANENTNENTNKNTNGNVKHHGGSNAGFIAVIVILSVLLCIFVIAFREQKSQLVNYSDYYSVKSSVEFYDEFVAIVLKDDTTHYHKIRCGRVGRYSNFWIYDVVTAEAAGCLPCPECCE